MMRKALLAASENRALRDRAMKLRFVRRSVSRFMPGEQLEDALAAAARLRQAGIGAVLTQLGENVADAAQTDAVARHYHEVLAASTARALGCEISVKPTQLGLDVDAERCFRNLRTLIDRARGGGTFVWIDMEQHGYVDRTLELYRRAASEFANVGVCLQAYLYRTADDLAAIRPLGGGVRLVKGAYREPPTIAYPRKRDVDQNFLKLAKELLAPAGRDAFRPVFGTHDSRMIAGVQKHAAEAGRQRDTFEFHLLYGIKAAMQRQLAVDGYRVRVLISYGSQWFPWYMRRLAERPANVWFVAKSILP
jgi:proline dehydrogenase